MKNNLFFFISFLQEKQPEIKNNDGNKKPTENLTVSSVNNNITSPRKSPSKAPAVNIVGETLKALPVNGENNNKNITHINDAKKKPEEANDGSNDDDDDSVFLKTEAEATTKHKNNAPTTKSSNAKTLNATVSQEKVSATQNPISRESNVQTETVVR